MSISDNNSLGKENVEALDKLHCFGSRWFCLQMQEAFDVQSSILKEIAFKHANGSLKPILPLIHGLHTTSDTISLLRRDGLLNEAHVLMRLLIERALNACYLLVAPSDSNLSKPIPNIGEQPQPRTMLEADEIINLANDFRFKEIYDSDGLELKINTIASKTKVPIAFLRQLISQHYPHASLALSGSPTGAIFHLFNVTEGAEDHLAHNFATLLFGGLLLLNYSINIFASYGIPENLIKESDASVETALAIMRKGIKPSAAKVRDAHGWWQTLADHEYLATKKLAPQLREFELAFRDCVEAGMEAPMIATPAKDSIKLQVSALYLKRLLNDVRSMWLMMRQGNTSQAGSIAASLFENALMIQCLAENESRAIRLAKSPTAQWPWDKKTMCNFINRDTAAREKAQVDQQYADAHYAQYSWLCQIKHTTLGYAGHDSGSTHVEEKGYLVMPFPDVREEDWPVKRKILLISLHNTIMAIQAFARGGNVKETTPKEISFASKLESARDFVEKNVQASIIVNGS